jgi:epsilon-lactone hydrolase
MNIHLSKAFLSLGLGATLMHAHAVDVPQKDVPKPTVDAGGTVHIPTMSVPYSSLASEGAKQNFISMTTGTELSPPMPAGAPIATFRKILDEKRMRPVVERLRAIFPVTIAPETFGGVQIDVVEPAGGVARRNNKRVLINLHGGGFMVGARYGGQQESIPIASLGGFRVVTVDYRMAPEYKFPAAGEDVAAVYQALLKQYEPENIGIYGCSAGGMLTAQSTAWFQRHGLPRPGAIGMFGAAGIVGKWGDSGFVSSALGGRMTLRDEDTRRRLAYFSEVDFADPLVSPAYSLPVLREFPPALLISGTRDDMLSSVVYMHAQLVKAGRDADLHVWEGATHCAFAQPVGDPDFEENREVWDVIVKFFDSRLGR